MHALVHQLFTLKHTMIGLEFQDNMEANGTLHTRVLGVVLCSHLQEVYFLSLRTVACAFMNHDFATNTTSYL